MLTDEDRAGRETFHDLAIGAFFFLAGGGALLKKMAQRTEAGGGWTVNALVLSTSALLWIDPRAIVRPMIHP